MFCWLKKRNVSNRSQHKPETNRKARLYSFITTVKNPKNLGVTVTQPQWKIAVDERTGHNT